VLKTNVSAFAQALAGFGWIEGRNVRIDVRPSGADTDRMRALAQELVGLQPDIILANSPPVAVHGNCPPAREFTETLCD
jgi:hypothetical protein